MDQNNSNILLRLPFELECYYNGNNRFFLQKKLPSHRKNPITRSEINIKKFYLQSNE